LVSEIVDAYERHDAAQAGAQQRAGKPRR
jgi:hypothetical protein